MLELESSRDLVPICNWLVPIHIIPIDRLLWVTPVINRSISHLSWLLGGPS